MVWPYDAIDNTYGALDPVLSANLNQIQNRVVDLHRDYEVIYMEAMTQLNAGMTWSIVKTQEQSGWQARIGAEPIYFMCRHQTGGILESVQVKYFNNGGAPVTPDVVLFRVTPNFTVTAGNPSKTTEGTSVTVVGAGAWNVCTISGLSLTLSNDQRWLVAVGHGAQAPAAGDSVAGVRLIIQPLTATP